MTWDQEKAMEGKKRQGQTISARERAVIDNYFGPSNFNKKDALRRAGYANPANAHGVFWRPKVKAEIERRHQEVKAKYEVTYERVLDEIARVAFSSILDFAEITEDGQFILDERTLAKADADELKAIGEVTVETFIDHYEERPLLDEEGNQVFGPRGGVKTEKVPVHVKRVRIKPYGKLEALEKLMRHAGLSKEKNPLDGVVDLIDRINAGRRRAGG